MTSCRIRCLLVGMLLLPIFLCLWPQSATAQDVSHQTVTLVAALDSQSPLNPVKKKQGDLASQDKASFFDKNAETQKFAIMWLLSMLAGLLIWFLWPKGKSLQQWIQSKPEEEPESLLEATASHEGVRIRSELIAVARKWQGIFGVSPLELSSIAGFDIAMLLGLTEEQYVHCMQGWPPQDDRRVDFILDQKKYLIKAYRQAASLETGEAFIAKAQHTQWDFLIFVLYDIEYTIIGAWRLTHHEYMTLCHNKAQLTLEDFQQGERVDVV